LSAPAGGSLCLLSCNYDFSFTDISVYSAVAEFGVVFFKQAFDVLQNVFHFISLLSILKNEMFFFLVTSYCGAIYM